MQISGSDCFLGNQIGECGELEWTMHWIWRVKARGPFSSSREEVMWVSAKQEKLSVGSNEHWGKSSIETYTFHM